MKTALSILLFVSLTAFGQTPLKSIGFGTVKLMPCDGTDQLMPLDSYGNDKAPPAVPNAGPLPGVAAFPQGAFHIRSVCVMHHIMQRRFDPNEYSYAYVGLWGTSGDQLTPYLTGSGYACKDFPADAHPIFHPGDYLDVHATCSGGGTHFVSLQVWYTDH